MYKQNDTLYLKWESVNIEMKHHHYNVYTTKWNISHTEMNVLIAYEMDVEGKLSQFKLHLPPMLGTKFCNKSRGCSLTDHQIIC